MKKDTSTILERLAESDFPMSRLYEAKNNTYLAPLANLILASEQITAQSKQPWTFKSLSQIGAEEFIRTARIYDHNQWERIAQREYADCIGRWVYYEENEGLLFFVQDKTGQFRVARQGDAAYDFVRRLNDEGSVSDLRFAKAPKWAEELFLGHENLEAYKLVWYDNSELSNPRYEQAKKLMADTVIRETVRRMGNVPGLKTPLTDEPEAHASHVASNEVNGVTVNLPHMTKALSAVFEIMRENWTNFDPKRLPKQVNIASEIDMALGWQPQKDGTPSRNAKVIAALIKPDTISDNE